MTMPAFVARCLEEVGLEGRCGLPLRAAFALADPACDDALRRGAWRVLRALRGHVRFHHMQRIAVPARDAPLPLPPPHSADESDTPPRRKRKWSTTLLPAEADALHAAAAARDHDDDVAVGESDRRTGARAREPVVPSARRQALRRQKRQKLRADARGDRDDVEMMLSGAEEMAVVGKSGEDGVDRFLEKEEAPAVRAGDDPASADWVLRSPRGFALGVEIDASDLSYDDAMTDAPEGVLGVVACEELRLKYLGVTDPMAMDTLSPQFDLLEMIGRAREKGESAAALTNSNVFGDSRKLHYLLDMLVASGYVEKNMVTADQKRFNILHLARFARRFHPSMVSPTATMEREAFPKKFIPYVMAEMLVARGERTCVFADIGRELGYDKRYQEKLRKYFAHQMHVNREFPLELFMARCNTGSTEQLGRKLWCIRLRHGLRRGKDNSAGRFESIDPPAPATTGPVVERGIMEQMYTSIQSRCDVGATIPEIRDMLGVPTFKLPYKLAQGLISKYKLTVKQVVVGKSTMYRMFIPESESVVAPSPPPAPENSIKQSKSAVEESDASDSRPGDTAIMSVNVQPSTMRQASRGVLVSTTYERRRNYILERIRKDKIVPVHHLRTELTVLERNPAFAGTDLTVIDTRSIRRILDDFEAASLVVSVDITLPPKRVLQKRDRVVKCVCMPGYQRDREAITRFVDAYVEEQQRRYMSDLGPPEMADVVVVSNRGRGKRGLPVQDDRMEVIKYAAGSYRVARVNLVRLGKQSRRLGLFFGMLYRCRALHIIMWSNIQRLREKAISISSGGGEEEEEEARSDDARHKITTSGSSSDVVFAVHEVLDLLSVKEYLQLAGVNELLTDAEENKVRMAIVRGDSWEILPSEIRHKIRGCEVDRFSRIIRTLIELGLIEVSNDSSSGLLNIFRSNDFDAMVSQVASATLSGGLLKLKNHGRITVKRGDTTLTQLPTEQSYVYAARFTGRSLSEDLVGKIPLEFKFTNVEDAKEYWKALRFLSVEGAHLGSKEEDGDTLSANLDSEQIRAAPLSEHNLHSLMSWIPRGMTPQGRNSAKSKAVEAAAEPMRILKRKRFQNHIGKAIEAHTKAKHSYDALREKGIGARMTPASDGTEAAVSKFRRLVSSKQSVRASKWTLEEDMKLMDAYMDELSSKWFIEIPLALQKGEERLAFRNASLERAHISWKKLSKALGKKFTDCYLRVNELLTVPAVRARVESTKLSITQMKNPGGHFHEELALLKQPRLAALLNRALQILFHDRSSYHPVLADMLISQWTEAEVKLVWRYLWLAGVITRTRKPSDGEQQERGFCIHSRVYEMKSLNIAHYPIDMFCEAAEYASFVQENVKEAVMLEGEGSDVDGDSESYFEHEFEQNASAGQVAVELSSMLLSVSEMVPEYVELSAEREIAGGEEDPRRAAAMKGFAGHLSSRCSGATPDDFLKEYWIVKSRAQMLLDEDQQEVVMERAKQMEAFSTCPALSEDTSAENPSSGEGLSVSPSCVVDALNEATADGLSFSSLCAAVHARQEQKSTLRSVCRNRDDHAVRRVLDGLVQSGRVIEVSGFTHARFVLKEHSEIWTLHPYRVSNEAAPGKVHFVFDKQQTVVARPWYLLDGSTNSRIELVLKRKVVNIIMCSPGIQDHSLHQKMRKLLSLQGLRTLLDELITDEIVYARVVSGAARKPRNIFKTASWSRPRVDARAVVTLAPGDAPFVNTKRDEIHYFPAVNCVELLGAVACDADVRRN